MYEHNPSQSEVADVQVSVELSVQALFDVIWYEPHCPPRMLAEVVAETLTTSPGNRAAEGRTARAADAMAKAKSETRDIVLLLQKPEFLTDRQISAHVLSHLTRWRHSSTERHDDIRGCSVSEISVGSELSYDLRADRSGR